MKQKLRPVLFRKWVPAKYDDDFNGGKPKEGTSCYSDYIYPGDFHQWAAASSDNGEMIENYTVALIELPDGRVESVKPQDLKFFDK